MIIYDAHTHQFKKNSVVSIDTSDKTSTENIDFFSKGIHPWSLKYNSNIDELLSLISGEIKDNKLLAIGETGLDRLTPEFDSQKVLFRAHVELAQHLSLPMIVHCVKSQNDILNILKNKSFKNRVMFHGFNGSKEEALELIKKGHCIGIGPQLFKEMKINKYLNELPIDSLLLETDDSDLSTHEIIGMLSSRLRQSKEELATKLNNNFTQFFNC